MPQYSHMMLPSSLWKESTERSPLIDRSFCTRASTEARASATASWDSSSLSNGPLAR